MPTLPGSIAGHGGVGIGMSRSRSITNLHGFSSVFVTVKPAVGSLLQLPPPYVTLIDVFVSNSGHGKHGSCGTGGTGQSNMGGGGSAIEQSEINKKSTLGTSGTVHLFGSKSGCVILCPAVSDQFVVIYCDAHKIVCAVGYDADSGATYKRNIWAAYSVDCRNDFIAGRAAAKKLAAC